MASSGRGSLPYRIAKKCEDPGDSRLWQTINFFFCQAMILYGTWVYKKIKKGFPDKTIIMYPFNSGGDATYYGHWKEYLLDCIGKKESETVLICSQYMKKPFEAVSIANLYTLPMQQICALNMAYHFYGSEKIDLVNACGCIVSDVKNIYNKDLKPKPLDFRADKNQVRAELTAANCRPGRTVVLSPYENSITARKEHIPVKHFWVELAGALKAAGFDVCTNCFGDSKEPVIEGTSRVFPRLNECEELVDQAGATVTIRSGFADWSAFTKGTMVILYPSQQFREMCSVSYIRDVDDHYEIVYEGDISDGVYRQELILQIVGMLKNAKAD